MTSQPWDLPEKEITPPKKFFTRRRVLSFGLGFGAAAAIGAGTWWWYRGGSATDVLNNGRVAIPNQQNYYPAQLNQQFAKLDRPLTDRVDAARYCNFYELSGNKAVWRYVEDFQPVPWKLTVTGLVNNPLTLDIDDLHRTFPLEERRYRHRCVEAWAMAVPWTGFALKELLKKAEPTSQAKYVRFVSFHNPQQAPQQKDTSMPWPYTEGLRLDEAMNDLTFLATGVYGEPLLKQHGAPIRLVVPWKYGYKSAKSIVRIELTDVQPATFWNTLQPHEYGFESNVNPAVDHPRWSQKTEKMLTTGERRPTQIYNGYGKWVAHLYRPS